MRLVWVSTLRNHELLYSSWSWVVDTNSHGIWRFNWIFTVVSQTCLKAEYEITKIMQVRPMYCIKAKVKSSESRRCRHTVHVLLWFVVFFAGKLTQISQVYLTWNTNVIAQVPTLYNMGKWIKYIHTDLLHKQNKTQPWAYFMWYTVD